MPTVPARVIERNDPSGEEPMEADAVAEIEKRNEKATVLEAEPKPDPAKISPEEPNGLTASTFPQDQSDEKQRNELRTSQEKPFAEDSGKIAAPTDTVYDPVSGEVSRVFAAPVDEDEDSGKIAAPTDTAYDPISGEISRLFAAPVDEDKVIEKMIGQMIVVRFQGLDPQDVGVRQVISGMGEGRVGGVIMTGRNIRSPSQLKRLSEALRKAGSDTKPFLMIEYPGGNGQPLSSDKGFSNYPSPGELGQSNDPLNAFNVYRHLAEELASFGVTVNIGPGLALQSGKQGTPIQLEMSYGSTEKHVAAFAKAFQLAHEQQAVITAPKFFPAGGVDPDQKSENDRLSETSHRGWDVSALKLYGELLSSTSTRMVLVGHAINPAISDRRNLPASLSKLAVQVRLRDELGFRGIAITGDLEASELVKRFSLAERVELAILAGNDILQIGDNQASDKIVAMVKEALAQGKLTRERIKSSYKRIVALKESIASAAKTIASVDHQRVPEKSETRTSNMQ